MDVTLTDLLVCPHCGPPYGLILLADSVAERRVLAGTLGCANCYRRYPVREGVADLRTADVTGEVAPEEATPPGHAPGSPEEATSPGHASGRPEEATSPGAGAAGVAGPDHAFRLKALMGLSDATGAGRAVALLAGPVAEGARAVAAAAEGYEIVAAGADAGGLAGLEEAPGVSRILVAERLPFLDGSVRGVTLSGEAADRLLEEGVRVLNPMGRLVLEGAPPGAAERIAAAGGRVVAAEGGTVVAVSLRGLSGGP